MAPFLDSIGAGILLATDVIQNVSAGYTAKRKVLPASELPKLEGYRETCRNLIIDLHVLVAQFDHDLANAKRVTVKR